MNDKRAYGLQQAGERVWGWRWVGRGVGGVVVAAAAGSLLIYALVSEGLERMTLPVGRNGSSGSRTGVLGSLSRGRRTVFVHACVCVRVRSLSPVIWFVPPFNTCPPSLFVEVGLHFCSLKFQGSPGRSA